MKWYSLKYRHRSPPGGQEMWKVEIDPNHKVDDGLLAHELVHVKQWYAAMLLTFLLAAALWYGVAPVLGLLALFGPWTHNAMARVKMLRIQLELQAYKVHVKIGVGPGLPYRDREFAIKAMVGHGMDAKDARRALG